MQRLRIRIRTLARQAESDDEREGEHLASLVRGVLERGGGGAVGVVVRPDRTELIDLRGVVEADAAVPMFLAGLTRSEPEGQQRPVAVGLAGKFRFRTPAGAEHLVGIAFLEWSDCRWWHWRVALDAEGVLVPDSEIVRRAADGDSLPGGLGRWWSLGRRTGNMVRYGPAEPLTGQDSPLVH